MKKIIIFLLIIGIIGITHVEANNNTFINGEIVNCSVGIEIKDKDGINMTNNTFCDNIIDINVSNSFNLTGNNNTCNTANNWNDSGDIGCSFSCITLCDCFNCTECQDAINNEDCTFINLLSNIYDYPDNDCIIFNNIENKELDCNFNTITGDNDLQNGIYISNNSNNISIYNCVISNFQNGIKIQDSIISNIENNILCDNWEWDIIDWDKTSYGVNNTATNIYNFVDIGYIDSTTNQCITPSICIDNTGLIAIYIAVMFIFVFAGLIIDKQLFYILFGFCLFMLSFQIRDICEFDFLWFLCFFVSLYFLFKCLIKDN